MEGWRPEEPGPNGAPLSDQFNAGGWRMLQREIGHGVRFFLWNNSAIQT
jgi:hypothetical protein